VNTSKVVKLIFICFILHCYSDDTKGITIEVTEGEGSKRYYRKAYCPYCEQPFAKMIRHLETVHSMEDEVKQLESFPKKSIARKKQCLLIQNKGNLKHNIKVLREKKGTLKVARRPEVDSGNYKVMCLFLCLVINVLLMFNFSFSRITCLVPIVWGFFSTKIFGGIQKTNVHFQLLN